MSLPKLYLETTIPSYLTAYDVHKIGDRMRQREREEIGRGVRYVSFVQRRGAETESCVVREEPGQP